MHLEWPSGSGSKKCGLIYLWEKRGESYPREITRLTQLNPNQLCSELERMACLGILNNGTKGYGKAQEVSKEPMSQFVIGPLLSALYMSPQKISQIFYLFPTALIDACH